LTKFTQALECENLILLCFKLEKVSLKVNLSTTSYSSLMFPTNIQRFKQIMTLLSISPKFRFIEFLKASCFYQLLWVRKTKERASVVSSPTSRPRAK
jgi:hypothetical protein